jgi:uncharacterized protein YuzE
MRQPIVKYDETSDSLYITFEIGRPATGIELNDLLRYMLTSQAERSKPANN